MTTISLRLPESLHDRLRKLAVRDGVSINQFVTLAIAEKMAALLTEEVLVARARRGDRKSFERALARVAEAPPEPYDTVAGASSVPRGTAARRRRRRSES